MTLVLRSARSFAFGDERANRAAMLVSPARTLA